MRVSLRRVGASAGRKVMLPASVPDLLTLATSKLELSSPATKIFFADGDECGADDLELIATDDIMYVSCGETFCAPSAGPPVASGLSPTGAGQPLPVLPGSAVQQAAALGVIENAALSVGEAAASLANEVHMAKVQAYVQRQTKLNPLEPRLLYGCDHDGTVVSNFNKVMNQVALELIKKTPSLLRFQGSTVKKQALIEAARVQANALYNGNFAKKGGSKAAGIAGDAGHQSSSGSSTLKGYRYCYSTCYRGLVV